MRLFDKSAFTSKSIHEVLKQLDPTNVKILSTMAKVGPRNLLEVSRLTGIPFTTVYYRIAQIEAKSGRVVQVLPSVARLGMARVMVLLAAKPGLEDLVTRALKIPNYWRAVQRCEGAFTHHSIQTVPTKFLREFREYISTMQAMNLIKSCRIIQTGDSHPIFPDFSYYNFSSGDWTFIWDVWLNELKTGSPAEKIQDPCAAPLSAEKIDIDIVAYLETNGRMKFTDIAEKINVTPQTVKYHYDKKLVEGGVVERFDFLLSPYPVEMSAFHEFMLEFPDAASMNRFFSVSKKLFFIHHLAKALRKNTLLLRTGIVDSQVENLFTFFSEMVSAGQLTAYSAVRLNMSSRSSQTISNELFDPELGWQWDVYKNLLELNKL